jgi:hypothetical protein
MRQSRHRRDDDPGAPIASLTRLHARFRDRREDGLCFDRTGLRAVERFFALARFLFAGARFFLVVSRFPLARLPGARSGSLASPVSRFHSSNVSGDISPFTRSSANLRRCALLLKGMA